MSEAVRGPGGYTVIGATGLVGAAVVGRLAGRVPLRVLARGTRPRDLPASVSWEPFPQLDYFAGVWEVPERFAAMVDVAQGALGAGEVLVSCLGTTRRRAGSAARFRFVDLALNLAFATAARRRGYRRYGLVSSYGADAGSRWLYPRTKGELEDGVRALGFEATYIARPGLLLGRRREGRFGESLAGAALAIAHRLGLSEESPYGPIAAETVATALAAALRSQAAAGAHTLYNADLRRLGE